MLCVIWDPNSPSCLEDTLCPHIMLTWILLRFSHTVPWGGKCLLNSFPNVGWLFLSTSADLSCFSNSLSNISNDRDNLQRTKSREEIKMHWVSRPVKSDSISSAPLSISKSLTCQKVESVPGLDKQIRGLPSQGKRWAGRVRKRESNGRGGALLKIHTLPFSSNTFLRQWEPWTLQQSLELQQSLSQLRPGFLPEIRMHCGTNCAHGYCFYLHS